MESIDILKAELKADRRSLKEWYKVIETYYSLSGNVVNDAMDYLLLYEKHLDKNKELLTRTINKLKKLENDKSRKTN